MDFVSLMWWGLGISAILTLATVIAVFVEYRTRRRDDAEHDIDIRVADRHITVSTDTPPEEIGRLVLKAAHAR